MVKKSSKTAAQPTAWSYEDTVAKVEAAIAELESGNLPLAEVLVQFEQAVESLQQCESYLADKQQQVNLLIETLNET